jgi:glutaredoxin
MVNKSTNYDGLNQNVNNIIQILKNQTQFFIKMQEEIQNSIHYNDNYQSVDYDIFLDDKQTKIGYMHIGIIPRMHEKTPNIIITINNIIEDKYKYIGSLIVDILKSLNYTLELCDINHEGIKYENYSLKYNNKNKIILYSTGCPNCQVLKAKLEEKNIEFEVCSDTQKIMSTGFRTVPLLEINGEIKTFTEAIMWVMKQ